MFKKLFGKRDNAPAAAPLPQAAPADPVEAAFNVYNAAKADLGETHPDTLQALFAFGKTLNTHRRFQEAEAAGHELRTLFEGEFGPDHPNVGYGHDIIATALAGQGNHAGALESRQRSIALIEGHFGPDHEMTLERARFLAVDHVELGQTDEAKAVLEKYMPAAQAIPPVYADFMDTSAFVAQASDGPDAAIPILEELITFYRTHDQHETAPFASKLFNLAQLYLQAERKDDALSASSEAGMVALGSYGVDHPASQDIFGFQTALREAKERGEF